MDSVYSWGNKPILHGPGRPGSTLRVPYWSSLYSARSDCLQRIPGWDRPSDSYRPQYWSLHYGSYPSPRVLPEEMPSWLFPQGGFSLIDDSGCPRGDDHTSIAGPFQNYSDSILQDHRLSHSCHSNLSSSQFHSASVPVSYSSLPATHPPSSSPPTGSCHKKAPFTGPWEEGTIREELEAVDNLPAMQARLPVPILSKEKPKSQKKVSPTYFPSSCTPSSFSGNQNGPTSYFLCHENPTVSVYTSRASDAHRSRKPLASSSKDDGMPSPSLTSLSN